MKGIYKKKMRAWQLRQDHPEISPADIPDLLTWGELKKLNDKYGAIEMPFNTGRGLRGIDKEHWHHK